MVGGCECKVSSVAGCPLSLAPAAGVQVRKGRFKGDEGN